MQSYSWLELQRGLLSFQRGQYTDAARHYERADRAFPGHWYTDEHFAELMAAEGKLEDAVALLRQVLLRVPKPELQQALGELYLACGREEEAQPWFDRAQAKYLESVERGDVHYFHHLADFYSHARKDPSEALRWARKDLELRSNFSTQAAMAWALYCNDQLHEAIKYIRQALSSGVQDGEIFSVAASLFEAAGESAQSQIYAAAALRINARFDNFHMHH
jgi:tetratricopeptide (TPR) repeat protein